MSEEHDIAIDNAWKLHSAIVDWTGKVDSKASFTLAMESAILIGITTLSEAGRVLSNLEGREQIYSFRAGVFLLVVGVILVARVVAPRLRTSRLDHEVAINYIYFGHLRYWNPQDLESRLRSTNILPALSFQIINMSKIAWQKHQMLRCSLIFAGVGSLLVGLAPIL